MCLIPGDSGQWTNSIKSGCVEQAWKLRCMIVMLDPVCNTKLSLHGLICNDVSPAKWGLEPCCACAILPLYHIFLINAKNIDDVKEFEFCITHMQTCIQSLYHPFSPLQDKITFFGVLFLLSYAHTAEPLGLISCSKTFIHTFLFHEIQARNPFAVICLLVYAHIAEPLVLISCS